MKARRFALYAISSPRARYLGLGRRDGGEPVPTVWATRIYSGRVLAYFGSRREQELVIDPHDVRFTWPILHPRYAEDPA